MDYPCSKFWFYRAVTHTDKQMLTQTDADERFTPATIAGVSKERTIAIAAI